MTENAEGISPAQRLARRWFTIARVIAALAILISATNLLGWVLNAPMLRRPSEAAGSMNPVTSIEYLIAAVVMILLTIRRWPRTRLWTVRVLSMAICVVGIMRIASVSGPWGERIDYALFTKLIEQSLQSGPCLMSTPTAVELMLIGGLLLLLTIRLGRWESLMALPSLGISIAPLLVVIGHMNGVASLSGVGSPGQMALMSALGLIILSGALVCVDGGLYWSRQEAMQSEDPTSESASRAMERMVSVGFAAALVVMTLVGAASYKTLEQFQEDSRWDSQTRDNLACLSAVGASVMQSDIGARGYVLSGEKAWLKQYEGSAGSIGSLIQQLRKMMADNAAQQERLSALCPMIGRKLQGLRRAIDLRRQDGLESAQVAITSEDPSVADGIRRQLDVMCEVERGVLASRMQAASWSAKMTIGIIVVGSLIGLALIGLAGWMIHRDIASRRHAEQELREAKAIAEAANRAKSEFLAHMSHEIRTPLNGVLGMTDLILSTELGEQQRRYGLLAKSSAESLTSVINDILDFSKIEAGKLEIVAHEFNLHTAVGDVMDVMAQAARRKAIELACHIGPGVPSLVSGDCARMRQIMINLVNNAIKFTKTGGVIVRLTLESTMEPIAERPEATIETILTHPVAEERPQTKNTIKVRFSVTDTGIGIPQDRIDRLFKAFSQADASTTRVYGGTGLGLVITKQLAGLLGGEVGVESEPNKGSTFWFTAQFELNEDSDVAQSRLREAMWASARSSKRDPRNIRVLIVDENPVQRDAIHEQVEGWGLTATTATDGAQGITLLEGAIEEKAPYSVVIVDCDMPGMEAPEFARAVRGNEKIAETVLMTLLSVDTRVDTERLHANGFSGYLSKPVRQGDVFKAIMDSIALGKQDAGPAPAQPIPMADYFPARSDEGAAPKILLAEDNEVNRIVATEILRKAGYRFETAVNGKIALEAVKKDYYDLVLMDCQMPVMDGFEATREIRAWERGGPAEKRRTIPIIALTANAMKGDRERCLQAGMDAYTSKPIDPKHLLTAMKDLLNRGNATQQAA
jgi:signal transduction histidine kinase/CheY-like chemotaxis protein